MNTLDFAVCLLVAGVGAVSVAYSLYWITFFLACLFILVVCNISLFHFALPQPRYIIGMEIQHDEEENETETE